MTEMIEVQMAKAEMNAPLYFSVDCYEMAFARSPKSVRLQRRCDRFLQRNQSFSRTIDRFVPMNFASVGHLADSLFFKSSRGSSRREERRSPLEELLEDGRRWSRANCPQISIFFTVVILLRHGFVYLWNFLKAFDLSLRCEKKVFFVNDSREEVLVCVDSRERSLPDKLKEEDAGILDALAEGFQKVGQKTADLLVVARKAKFSYSLYVTVLVIKGAKEKLETSCISHPIDRYSTVVLKDGAVKVVKSETLPAGSISDSVTVARSPSQCYNFQNWFWRNVDRFCWQLSRKCPRLGVLVSNSTSGTILVRCVVDGTEREEGGRTQSDPFVMKVTETPEQFLSGTWTRVPSKRRVLFEPEGVPTEGSALEMHLLVYSIAEGRVHCLKRSADTTDVSFPENFGESMDKSRRKELEELEKKRLALHYD
ncbi:hypothetical protein QR680_009778 [Steinernema hermaphroditum]|uniref:Uncharacterized protein n=1 Tax=Steinernema hermaphroditum TaxID=289476 RepID=A0AA39MAD4_9BILA|nr:hypothetical protein QR680_009778 [Steinernema hermaphroditum]